MKDNRRVKTKNWKSFFAGKRVTVMGLGLLGRGVGDVRFIAKYAEEVIVTDLKTKKELQGSVDQLKNFKNIRFVLGQHREEDFENRDFIIKAAGVPFDSIFVNHARAHGVPVYMSTALFAKMTEGKVIGITGTRGKTTVTSMLHAILTMATKDTKRKVFLGGNIQGMATLPLLTKVQKGDWVVLELDSWQLQGFGDLGISPEVAVFTTFMPDHLNYYKGDLLHYFDDKAKIFKNQHEKDCFIAGEQLCSLPKSITCKLPKSTRFISTRVLQKTIKLSVPGEHNRYNAAVAFAAARALKVPIKIIKEALEEFQGVPGRLEKVGEIKGVEIYNDTTSTTPAALVAALEAVGKNKNTVLIAGGSDKSLDVSVLKNPIARSCKAVILLNGSGTEKLIGANVFSDDVQVKNYSTLKQAVRSAFSLAQNGDTILFSPGFTSFGMFKNEYDRGEKFIECIKSIKKASA
jgi:UDP-N-acetylmuramoylalanine--D-glutamate ligase